MSKEQVLVEFTVPFADVSSGICRAGGMYFKGLFYNVIKSKDVSKSNTSFES